MLTELVERPEKQNSGGPPLDFSFIASEPEICCRPTQQCAGNHCQLQRPPQSKAGETQWLPKKTPVWEVQSIFKNVTTNSLKFFPPRHVIPSLESR